MRLANDVDKCLSVDEGHSLYTSNSFRQTDHVFVEMFENDSHARAFKLIYICLQSYL